MLTPDRWQIVERVFHEALARPPAERTAFIASSCGDDEELKSEVSSLLAAEAESGSLDESVTARAAADWARAGSGAPPLIGREIDGYKVVSLIGAGGMGEVYLAQDPSLGRQVALKVLPMAFTSDAGRLRRFTEEARAASGLNHPNIITVHHVGEFDGRRFIVMEHVDGVTLRAELAGGAIPAARALKIAEQAALALAAAHRAGIVHRDIKPENLMLRPDGYVKVLDFGLAKLLHPSDADGRRSATRAGVVLGTVDYMAPEQAAGFEVDARADLYSLSVVLHEMLTGLLPRESATSERALSGDLLRLVGRGIATNPAARYQSAAELARDLEATRARLVAAPVHARRLRWAAAATIAAVVIVAALGWRNPNYFNRVASGPGANSPVPAADVVSARRGTTNPEAYQLYLRGRYYQARLSRQDVERSLTFFEQALALDPTYALAHAGIGAAHRTLALTYTQGSSPATSFPLARQAAQKALELDSELAEAWVGLGWVQSHYDHDWRNAEASLKRAVELGATNPEAHRTYGWYLAATGKREESIASLRRAVELNPSDAIMLEGLGNVLAFAGRLSEAVDSIDAAIRVDPLSARSHGRKVWMLEVQGRNDEAIAARQAGLRVAGRAEDADRLAALFAHGGMRAVLENDVKPGRPQDPINAAWAHLRLGDLDAALTALERGEREKHTWCVVINVDPRFAALHDDPRFKALLGRIGLGP